jgi:hypothetical protein
MRISTTPYKNPGRVVALSGKSGSGKDTAAEYLVEHYGYTRIALADILKEEVSRAHGIPLSLMHTREDKEAVLFHLPVDPRDLTSARIQGVFEESLQGNYWTPRALCLLEGATRRAVDPDYWVRKVLKEIEYHTDKIYVISDIRFISEVETLRRALGEELSLIRLERWTGSASSDPSETELDNYVHTCTAYNGGTVDALYTELDNRLMFVLRDK